MVSRALPILSENCSSAPIAAYHSPLEKTPHKARVEGVAEILTASGTVIAMDAERCRAAALDSPDDLQLRPGNARTAAVDKAVDPGAKDVGHFQYGPDHPTLGSGSDWRGAPRV